MTPLTKEQIGELEVAGLAIADLPKTHSELCQMIWRAFNIGKYNRPSRQVDAQGRALTPAQKRELDLLRKSGGYCHIYCSRTLNVFRNLEKKGFVELTACGVQLESGTHVTLIEETP